MLLHFARPDQVRLELTSALAIPQACRAELRRELYHADRYLKKEFPWRNGGTAAANPQQFLSLRATMRRGVQWSSHGGSEVYCFHMDQLSAAARLACSWDVGNYGARGPGWEAEVAVVKRP